jgi:hypothetical protein
VDGWERALRWHGVAGSSGAAPSSISALRLAPNARPLEALAGTAK